MRFLCRRRQFVAHSQHRWLASFWYGLVPAPCGVLSLYVELETPECGAGRDLAEAMGSAAWRRALCCCGGIGRPLHNCGLTSLQGLPPPSSADWVLNWSFPAGGIRLLDIRVGGRASALNAARAHSDCKSTDGLVAQGLAFERLRGPSYEPLGGAPFTRRCRPLAQLEGYRAVPPPV